MFSLLGALHVKVGFLILSAGAAYDMTYFEVMKQASGHFNYLPWVSLLGLFAGAYFTYRFIRCDIILFIGFGATGVAYVLTALPIFDLEIVFRVFVPALVCLSGLVWIPCLKMLRDVALPRSAGLLCAAALVSNKLGGLIADYLPPRISGIHFAAGAAAPLVGFEIKLYIAALVVLLAIPVIMAAQKLVPPVAEAETGVPIR